MSWLTYQMSTFQFYKNFIEIVNYMINLAWMAINFLMELLGYKVEQIIIFLPFPVFQIWFDASKNRTWYLLDIVQELLEI